MNHNKHQERNPNYTARRIAAGTIAASALLAAGYVVGDRVRELGGDEVMFPTKGQPHKEVVISNAKGGYDTAWGIARDAFPEDSPAKYADHILAQIPDGHDTLRPGDVVILPTEAAIGELVDPTQQG